MDNLDAKYIKMTQTPVPKLVMNLAIPSIISMVITAIYNMADTYFVSQINTSASAAVGISFSLMAIVQAIGFTMGMGSGNYMAQLLGQKDAENASKVAATGLFTTFGIGVVFSVVGIISLNPLVRLLGATPTMLPYAIDYIRYIFLGIPFMMSSYVLNNILRYQGSALYSMFGIGFGGILNIILDPIFIFKFNMGTGGAALATSISQFISFCLLLFASGKGGNLKIRLANFTPKLKVYKEILRIGMPSFYRQSLASIASIILNRTAGPFGDAAIAAMSIIARVFHLALSALLGFGQGFQPISGYNYGAKLYKRVIEAFWFCIKVAAIGLTIASIVGFIFAPQIISIFRKDDLKVIAIGAVAMRYQCITFPLSSWIILNNMLVQTIGKSREASILSLARQGLFFLPLILILPSFLGLTGVQLSQPIADLATFFMALPMGIRVIKELHQLQKEQDFLNKKRTELR
ncbi:MAG: MATE family efflux transporter [Clostridiaceae bacterium]|jgi:putative MATE family efflux protein|nr:MATE family efflux transporter [Clostridiaceae bacterium]